MLITDADITDRLDALVRPFFMVSCVPLPESTHGVLVDSLTQAINIFVRQCSLRKPVHIIIGADPLKIPLSNGTLSFKFEPNIIGVSIENFIFINVNAISAYPPKIQIACFLEEMVHSIMGVTDEATTSHIVAALYDGVRVINNKYVAI